jgi:hypothetical protein
VASAADLLRSLNRQVRREKIYWIGVHLDKRVPTICQERQELLNEISSLGRDLQRNVIPDISLTLSMTATI